MAFEGLAVGLFFEKGEPKKVKYAVEVFPKGDERASRPEQDAEEFAEYCQAAGWELVDGRRKFCIFRAIRSDAIPIATPEERYENICKSEREHLWMPVLFVFLALFIVKLMQGRTYRYAFEYSQLFLILFMVLMAVCSAADGAATLFWRWKKKRQLDAGEIPCYGRTFGISYEWYVLYHAAGTDGASSGRGGTDRRRRGFQCGGALLGSDPDRNCRIHIGCFSSVCESENMDTGGIGSDVDFCIFLYCGDSCYERRA